MEIEGFIDGAYETRGSYVAGSRCFNLFPEPLPDGLGAAGRLVPIPGVEDFAMMPQAPGRGIFSENGRVYTVFGNGLYRVAEDGTPTLIGNVAVDDNPATLSQNGSEGAELFVTSGRRGDIVELDTDTFVPGVVSDVTFGGQVNGTFVALDAVTSTLKASENLDGQTWNPLATVTRSAASDPWLAMAVTNREIILLGEKTGEPWYDAGLSPLPFRPRGGVSWQTGIVAPFTLTAFMGTVAWVGRTSEGHGGVYVLSGYSPQEISTPAIREAFEVYQDANRDALSGAIGWSYERGGHQFYVVTIPRADATWVYDGMTRRWHQRGRWDIAANVFRAYRPQFHAIGFGVNLVCDSSSNKIYRYSSTTYTDVDGGPLRRVRRFTVPNRNRSRVFIGAMELECDAGVGAPAGEAGEDPKVVLRKSVNRGHSWGFNRERSVGRRGDFTHRVRWNGGGSGRNIMLEVWSSDPVPTHWHAFHVF